MRWRKMVEVATDAETRRTCGERGRRYVQENLSWEIIVRNWLGEIASRKQQRAKR